MTSISKHIFLLSLLFIFSLQGFSSFAAVEGKGRGSRPDRPVKQATLPLFPPVKEQMEEVHRNDSLFGLLVSKVTNPTLSLFIPQEGVKLKSAVIICPGGGYHTLLMEREGARWQRVLPGGR